jgi:hypothetical protein
LVNFGVLKQWPYKTAKNGFLNAYDIVINEESIDTIFPRLSHIKGNNNHINLIKLLFTSKSNDFKEPRLKLANRLLLVVLLSHADPCGVVRSLGMSDLVKLTGMTKDRLKSQLEKLSTAGYIRATVSGVTGCYIFGVAKGMYWLNLKHENFQSHAYSGDMVSIHKGHIYESNYDRTAGDIFFIARRIITINSKKLNLQLIDKDLNVRSYLKEHHDTLFDIAYFFQDSNASRIQHYLQVKLDEYACFILSNHWEDMSNLDAKLTSKIDSDLFPSSFKLSYTKNDLSTTELKAKVVKFIHEMSRHIARELKAHLELIDDLSIDSSSYIPICACDRGRGSVRFIIDIHYNTSKPSYIYRVKDEDLSKRKFTRNLEGDFQVEEKYKYGVLTRPIQKEESWPQRKHKSDSIQE